MPADLATEFLTRLSQFCADQTVDLEALMETVLADRAPQRSPADLDHRALLASPRSADRQQLWHQVGLAQMHLAVNTIDHVRALSTVLSAPRARVPVYAHAGLARAAIESAALLLHLLADGETFDARLARGVALLIMDAGEAAKAARRVPGNPYMPSPGPKATADRDELLALVDRARIVQVRNRNNTATKSITVGDSPEQTAAVKASDLAAKHFADQPAIYNLLSGIVHGLPWRLADSATLRGREMLWEPDPMDIAGSVLAAVAAASRVGGGFAAYRGFPDDRRVVALAGRVNQVDRAMQTFGRKWGVLDGRQPTIARFLQPGPTRQ
ncbi:hypothetical protein AB0J83_03445 [Actinoplanes sp. NPDC049596]|uniref:hypothetical protein n=1 Tax=unclassified Actinoplanes TaxID=2626549 RepID=UPI003435C415